MLEAVDALADVVEKTHSQLTSRFDQVRRRRTELASKREHALAHRGEMAAEARRLHEERKYAAAYAVLERVPSSLRDQATRALMAEIERPLAEIKKHREALAKALKNSHPENGLPHAERLAELEPHADDVRRVCLVLRERKQKRDAVLGKQLLAEARDAIARNDYDSAGGLLDEMPPVTDENDRKLLSAIEERVWIMRQLKRTPYADDTLRSIAARLVKLQPKDKSAAKIELEIANRLSRAENRGGHAYVPWVAPQAGAAPRSERPSSPCRTWPRFTGTPPTPRLPIGRNTCGGISSALAWRWPASASRSSICRLSGGSRAPGGAPSPTNCGDARRPPGDSISAPAA